MSATPEHDGKAQDGAAGFTLVELLAALALLSILSVLLLGGLRFGLTAWGRAAAHSDRVDQVLLTQDFVRRIIEDAYPYHTSIDPTQGHVEFAGGPDSLRILASTPRALGEGRSWIRLAAIRREGQTDLAVTAAPELAITASEAPVRVLVPKVAGVEFAYFGKSRSSRSAGWLAAWQAETAPPQLVRIRVHFPPGDSRTWPELIIAPRISVDVACTYDPLTKRCRGR